MSILWIPFGKTKNAKRRLTVPQALRPWLAKLIAGRAGEELLVAMPKKPNKPYSETRLWQTVQSLCLTAGVPRVCTHSLRGLHATLSVSAGMTSEHVAASLGHASFAVTAKHSADGGAIADRATQTVSGTLLGQTAPVPERVRLAGARTVAELNQLRAALDRLQTA